MGLMVDTPFNLRADLNSHCPYCLGLEASRIIAENLLHRGVQDLRNSAVSSCGGCRLLFHGACRALAATGKSQHLEILEKGGNDRRYSLFIAYESASRRARDFRFLLLDTDEVSALASINFRSVYDNWQCFPSSGVFGDTASTESTEWAIDRVHHCQSHCVECRRPVGRLPTRVLDVGVPGEVNLQDDLQLREGGGERCQYACLSHRWGHVPLFRTFSSNLDALRTNVSFAQLPATFQDAIIFTRKVGLRYLWIDALCIVQDNHDDWEKEWANMSEVFTFSTLTLSATAARDDSQGLFRFIAPPPVLDFIDTKGRSRNMIVYESRLTSLSRELTKASLTSRAWAYQERLLSPRVLHFCNGFLVFECMHQTITEDGFYSATTSHPKIEHMRALSELSESRLAAKWRSIVQAYSWLNLTFERDRLPAIAGLAQQMARYRKDEYIDGLWSRSLLDDLAWRKPQRLNKRSDAPSWSWAKGDGGIVYDLTSAMTPQAQLINHSESNPGDNDIAALPGTDPSPRASTNTNSSTKSKHSKHSSRSTASSFKRNSSWSNLSIRNSMFRPTSSRVSSFITPSTRTTASGGNTTPTSAHSITLRGRFGRLPVILGQSFPKMRPLRLTEFVRDSSLPQPLIFPDTWLEADALEGTLFCIQLGYNEQYIFGLALKVRDETSYERIGLLRCEFDKDVPMEHQLLLMDRGCEETNVTIF